MNDKVEAEVRRIIAEQALVEPEQVRRETTLQGLGLDSLALVEVVFALEETFDITIPYNANDPAASNFDISTVGAVIDGIRTLVERKG